MTLIRLSGVILDGVALRNLHLQPVMMTQASKQASYQRLPVTVPLAGERYCG
jgi:hypothetical protein